MNAPHPAESTALAVTDRQGFDLSPRTFEQALEFSKYLAESDLVPKDFKGRPSNCLIAIQWGAELGLKPMQAMQNLAIINGRPSLWGDAVIALVRSSPLCEYVIETDDGQTATCKVKRRGDPSEQVRSFSMEDAQKAGLTSKQGPWTQYPKRMRQMRARAFALRDVFPDVLRGLPMAEEVMDTPGEKHMGMVDEVSRPTASYPQADFDKNFPKWEAIVAKGRKSSGDLIAFIESAGLPLTEVQKARLNSVKREGAAPDAFTPPSFAEVAEAIARARDRDALAAARDLIQHVAEGELRTELHGKADAREQELA